MAGDLDPNLIKSYQDIATAFANSGMFPDSRSMAQAFVKILAGREFGIGPFASMNAIHMVNGKPTLAATTVGDLIKRSGKYDYRVTEHDDKHCVIEFFQGKESLGFSSFSLTDAATAGLLSNPTWKKYPKAMTFSRAMTAGARMYTPDVFSGSVYTPEELGAPVTDEGEPVIKTVTPVAAAETPALPPRQPMKLAALAALYADAQKLKVVPSGVKLGAWMETSGIAPGLSTRDGRKPTDEEVFATEDAIRNLIDNAVPVVPVAYQEEPEWEDAPPEPEVIEPVGLSDSNRFRIMALFNAVGATKADARHHLATSILGPEKASTKTWTAADYAKMSRYLEDQIGPKDPTA